MTSPAASVSLADLQAPVAGRLARVPGEVTRIVEADFGLIAEVNSHLQQTRESSSARR